MAKSTRMTFVFLRKGTKEVRKMIAGPASVQICDSCVSVCKTIIDRELADANDVKTASNTSSKSKAASKNSTFNLIRPAKITDALDEHIISQGYAKRALAVAVYNHYKRLRADLNESSQTFSILIASDDVQIEKSNIYFLAHRQW